MDQEKVRRIPKIPKVEWLFHQVLLNPKVALLCNKPHLSVTILLTLLLSMVCTRAIAYDANVDGVYYNFVGTTAEVTYYSDIWRSGSGRDNKLGYIGEVTIPEFVTCNGNTYSVTAIGYGAFYGCTDLTSISIPNSVTSIGIRAFAECSSLITITIPSNVTSIPFDAFCDCTCLRVVNIPNSVTNIGDNAFKNCSSLCSVNIPNSVTKIGSNAFAGCNCLESVIIGSGVTKLDNILGNHKPSKVIWLTNTPPDGYINASGEVNFVANDSYKYLGNKRVYPFLSSLFDVDGIRYVPVSPSERTCDAIDCLYNEGAEHIIIGETVTNKGISLTVKQALPNICYKNPFIRDVIWNFRGDVQDNAFEGCTNMSSTTIHSQGSIGKEAFRDCVSLHSVKLGQGIASIGKEAFVGCSKLERIAIPDAVASLGESAFKLCSAMKSVVMGSGINLIEKSTFEQCASLTDMRIGNSVSSIGEDAFKECISLPQIVIPQSVSSINNYVFEGCKSLKVVIMAEQESELYLGNNGFSPLFANCPLDSVYIGRNIAYSTSNSKGYSPFYRNTSLRSVTITDKETEISPNEFYGCTNLRKVKIGNGVTKIGDWAFSGCCNLDFFSFGSSVESIGKEAFSDCTAITKLISFASKPPACGSQALDDINKWNCTLSVPQSCISAYQQADQWKEFFFINDGATGIRRTTSELPSSINIYDMNGYKNGELRRGINIIKMNDGTTRKMLVK